MIEVKPKIENTFVCPECGSPLPAVHDVVIQSVHMMADCTCSNCSLQFYQIFPVGHNVEAQLSVSKVNRRLYRSSATQPWLFDLLVKTSETISKEDVKIEKIVFKNCAQVVILNTLDYLYGHVLLKLYNSLHHLDQQKDIGLILIIPKMFKWLIPAGCAEAWIVDLNLSQLTRNYESIQKFVSEQFCRFTSIYLSRAYSHPDFTTIDISRLTGIRPFDLSRFREGSPVVTFVLREDRWWFGSIADYWFYRACRKLKVLSFGQRILTLRQNRLIKDTIKAIKKRLPHAEFYIVGLGRTGRFSRYANDERGKKIDSFVETAWCEVYAKSHVVVGVHGSNMLLPTALAAGCVEILPEERYGNMVQDISVRYSDRRQLFFYRFADQYASPRSVAVKVTSMIDHYDEYHKNMCRNFYTS